MFKHNCVFLTLFLLLISMVAVLADAPANLHKDFDLTFEDLKAVVPAVSFIDVRQARKFLSLAHDMLQMDLLYLRLVDKQHRLKATDKPTGLKELESGEFLVNKPGMMVEHRTYKALKAMLKAASKDGLEIPVLSAWRSYKYQENLVKQAAGNSAALELIAPPGASQHQLGTAVDLLKLDNKPSAESQWLLENAPEFGWSLSYPADSKAVTGYAWESWHWRWIGPDAVRMQKLFFDNSQQRLLEFWHEYASVLNGYHRIQDY